MRSKKYIILIFILMAMSGFTRNSDKMDFWSTQKKGANGALHKFRPHWFEAAADVGLEFVRVAPDQLPAEERDFLIGDADNFTAINETDLALLKELLDTAHHNNIKVVLVMFSLPGCRWRQLNNDQDDYRLWQQYRFQEQAFEFWRQLAGRLKDHPAIVAYNPLNEPHPAKWLGMETPTKEFFTWQKKVKDTPADLNHFNRRMVAAIRSVDPHTPIMLDGYFYADAKGLPFIEPVDDPQILYAFHNIARWGGLDYELGAEKLGWAFWQALERGEDAEKYKNRHDNPIWHVLKREFR